MAFDKHEPKHPWRENFECLAIAIIMALTLKHFVIEAYKIPTGSMQPTLMGLDLKELQIFDRILVDKLSYLCRNPERWEVVVFKYPLDQSKNYIKRLVGLPGEDLKILGGDIYVRQSGQEEFQIARKTKTVQDGIWRQVYFLPEDEKEGATKSRYWVQESGGWELVEHQLIGIGPGRIAFHREIRDAYGDGYPAAIQAFVAASEDKSGQNEVFDLRLSGNVLATPHCSAIQGSLNAGGTELSFSIPGPAGSNEGNVSVDGKILGRFPFRLESSRESHFAFAHYDRTIELEIDGKLVCLQELSSSYDPFRESTPRPLALETKEGGATFRNLRIDRDTYYTDARDIPRPAEYSIPPGHYLFLGDNTQSSSDGRVWEEIVYRIDERQEPRAPSTLLGGKGSVEKNPSLVPNGEGEYVNAFIDQFGEIYTFRSGSILDYQERAHPFVPREFIVGKAICVFWPVPPFSPIRRWKFIY